MLLKSRRNSINMKCVLIVVVLSLSAFSQASDVEDCKKYRQRSNSSIPEFYDCDEFDVNDAEEITCSVDESDCIDTMEFCWKEDQCYKPKKTSKVKSQVNPDAMNVQQLLGDLVPSGGSNNNNQQSATTNSGGTEGAQRTLGGFGGFGPQPPPNMCNNGPNFPFICGIGFNPSLNLLNPPLNVPYCRRVACGGERARNNVLACMINPGCYFDAELYKYRQMMNPRGYQGVPVCYHVINNPVFHKHAIAFKSRFGGWKPIYTQCLLKTYKHEMVMEQQRQGGCAMINSLQYLAFQPKLAGWTGIQKDECLYHVAGACWHKLYGCIYSCRSTSMEEVRVNPARIAPQERTIYSSRQIFGRQKCQLFPSPEPGTGYWGTPSSVFLSSYHRCLAAGCSMDPAAAYTYFYHFRDISKSVPMPFKQHFWNNVYSGSCNAHNYESFMKFYNGIPQPPLNPFAGNSFGGQQFNPHGFNPNQNPNMNMMGGVATPLSLSLERTLGDGSDIGEPQLPDGNQRTFGFIATNQPMYLRPQCPYFVPQFLQNHPFVKIDPYSMRTCCDKPACFHDNIYHSTDTYSGVTSYFGPSRWGPCSKSCGGGVRKRSQPCISINGVPCKSYGEDTEKCNTFKCPKFGDWSDYGECTKSCGGGKQSRTRECKSPNGAPCANEDGYGSKQSRDCREGSCPTFEDNAEWGPCVIEGNNPNCGKGKQLRQITCTDGGAYGCPSQPKLEQRSCAEYCGKWKASKGKCFSCQQYEQYKCETDDGSEGHCKGSPPPSRYVYCCPIYGQYGNFNNNQNQFFYNG